MWSTGSILFGKEIATAKSCPFMFMYTVVVETIADTMVLTMEDMCGGTAIMKKRTEAAHFTLHSPILIWSRYSGEKTQRIPDSTPAMNMVSLVAVEQSSHEDF